MNYNEAHKKLYDEFNDSYMNFCPNCGIEMAGMKKESSSHDSKKA